MRIPPSIRRELRRQLKSRLASEYQRGYDAARAEFDAMLTRFHRLKELNGTGELFKASWDESKHARDHGKFSATSDGSGTGHARLTGEQDAPSEPSDTDPDERATSFLERLAEVPKSFRDKVAGFVEARYAQLQSRYGETGAKAVLGAMMLLTPVPLPGTSLLPVAIAEVVRKLRRLVAVKAVADKPEPGNEPVELVELNEERTAWLARELLGDLYAEMGEEPPPEVLMKAFKEEDHPRDDHGQFINKDDLEAAKTDPAKAAELRKRVTKPEERAKLEGHIGGDKPHGKVRAALDALGVKHDHLSDAELHGKLSEVLGKKEESKADSIPGGLGDKKPDSAFPADQLQAGVKVEREHTDDPATAKEIAKDHLTEDPSYYDKLAKVEKPISSMGEAIALSSPSGKMSKRAERAAKERLRQELFGKQGLAHPQGPEQPSEAESLRRQAAELRGLAERGMKPRAYRKQAAEMEKRANELDSQT